MHTVTPWKHPQYYLGATWEGWYSAGFGQSRDSDVLEQSNFQAVYDALKPFAGDFDGESTVQIVREGHWAVGWVEWLAIHESNTAALDKARELCERANDYPVLNEEDFSRREDDECAVTWEKCFNASERLDYLRRHGEVYQLPARNGAPQYVPAVNDPWNNDCALIDFRSVADSKEDAARWADQMAEYYAESCREDQAKEDAKQRIEDITEEIKREYAEFRRISREIRANCDAVKNIAVVRELVRKEWQRTKATIHKLRAERERVERNGIEY